jgi:outer membrane protein OmpA-like peptidoglycan-associated protein
MTMQRHQDTNGGGRWLGLLGVSALALLAGCDWIGGGSTPVGPPPRPGAEKGVQPSASLPPGPVNPQYDAGVVGSEDRSAPAIGSIIAPKGGQKAQREAIEKEQAERDRKDREARLEREAAEKEEKAKEKQEGGSTPAAAPLGAPPPGAGTITSDQPPISAPVPPPAPVTSAPVAPPSAAPDPASAPVPVPVPAPTTPTPSGDPNRAFTPPAGWTPPGASEGSVTTGAPPASPDSAPPAAAPQPAADPNKALAPPSGGGPRGIDVGSVMTLEPLTVAFAEAAADACAEPAPRKADIARAQSGEVPFSALKSPPFDGSLQVAVIQFGPSSTGLDGRDFAVLARVADIQRDNGGTVRIVAHAAQDRDNFDVSRRRALGVAQELRRLGVPISQMVAEAASDHEPIYQTNTARGIAANRRVEVSIDFWAPKEERHGRL